MKESGGQQNWEKSERKYRTLKQFGHVMLTEKIGALHRKVVGMEVQGWERRMPKRRWLDRVTDGYHREGTVGGGSV